MEAFLVGIGLKRRAYKLSKMHGADGIENIEIFI